jgi:hypothetical protein
MAATDCKFLKRSSIWTSSGLSIVFTNTVHKQCSQTLFTNHVHKQLTNTVHKHCSQTLLTNTVHKHCSHAQFTNNVHKHCSQTSFTNDVCLGLYPTYVRATVLPVFEFCNMFERRVEQLVILLRVPADSSSNLGQQTGWYCWFTSVIHGKFRSSHLK